MMYAMSKEAMRTKEVEVIQFTVYGEPQGKGRPRFVARYNPATKKSFGQAHTPEKTIVYENLIRTEYSLHTSFCVLSLYTFK